MAEYYPLLAKAVGSLPNSTPDTRRVVYERARKALIGQLRTLHPPVPDEDIERESVELDRAIERLETELASAPPAVPPAPASADEPAPPVAPPSLPPAAAPPGPATPRAPGGALSALATRKPIGSLRPRIPRPAVRPNLPSESADAVPPSVEPAPSAVAPPALSPVESEALSKIAASAPAAPAEDEDEATKPRLETQRPIAPQPPVPKGPKRRVWIVPAGLGVVVLLVALAAWKLRVKPETTARNVPTITQEQEENGKIADRVGDKASPEDAQNGAQPAGPSAPSTPATTSPAPAAPAAQPTPATTNSEPAAAHRAALLVEAPDLPSKVQTFPGTVVWKLNNVNAGPSDAVGLQVEADVDLPDDKTKAVVTFEKNNDPSLPASHTIKVRFTVEPGSYSGDIKQINVPQMRREGNSDGEPLAGVTVPVIQNSFLVGLSPGNAETANLRLIGDLPWIDIPILLTSGKIAKLTFEKGAAGKKDINDALAYWQKP